MGDRVRNKSLIDTAQWDTVLLDSTGPQTSFVPASNKALAHLKRGL